MRTTTTVIECDVSGHVGDRAVPQPNTPKDQPFGCTLPNGDILVVCAVDVLKKGDDADAVWAELELKLREAYAEAIETATENLNAQLLSHRAELRKRRATKE